MKNSQQGYVNPLIPVGLTVVLVLIGGMLGLPLWNVWKQEQSGKADLAKAISVKQIMIAQAEAEKDAAIFRAEAIMIVGEAAQKYPEYRQQEYIGAFANAMENGTISQIIYIPTEAGIPILEAGKH